MTELNVQTALRSKRTLADLNIEFVEHPDPACPLVILNYSQIDSPKTHPIVKECRGLVLERDTWNVVAKSFNRFFNMGEDGEAFKAFDWKTCRATSKEDGSLMILYWYAGDWHVNTRGSFGFFEMQNHTKTWREVFWSLLPKTTAESFLDRNHTYVFEMCSVWNKVVRRYSESCLYLLTVVHNAELDEAPAFALDVLARMIGVKRPDHYAFSSENEVRRFLLSCESADPSFEGVVLQDGRGVRFKAKTATYLSLHHLRGEDGNLSHPRYLVPWVLKENPDELLTYFPEVKPMFDEAKQRLDAEWATLERSWMEARGIESQKDFALAIKDTSLAPILFKLRKTRGATAGAVELKAEFRAAGDFLLKRVFGVTP